MPHVRVLHDIDWMALRPEWDELVEHAPDATVFGTWEWVEAWWRFFGGPRKPFLIEVREGRDLIGLMPMYRQQGLWRTLRPMGFKASDYMDPLLRAGQERLASAALAEYLKHEVQADVVDLHQVRSSHPLVAALGDVPMRLHAECLVLPYPASYEALLSGLGKSLRYEAKRLDREVFTSGEARIWMPSTQEEVTRAYDILFDLHRRRWEGRGMSRNFVSGSSEAMHRRMGAAAFERDRLRLSILMHHDRPVGALYALRAGNATFFMQSGFEPEAKALSPGSTLLAFTIRQSISEGCARLDMLRGAYGYKLRWNPVKTQNLRISFPRSGVLGQAGHLYNYGSRDLVKTYKKLLRKILRK